MSSTPFSVLMSVYHKEKAEYLTQALESITSGQTLPPSQIILVKDGELTPQLDEVCDKFVALYPYIIKIVALPQNVGLGKALNEGLKHCSNELVARMDSDDISKPTRFEEQVGLFENRPQIDIASAWIEEFEEDTRDVVAIKKLPEDHAEILRYAKKRCPINHPVVMFKKSAVISCGGYIHMPLYEDYYLWARMIMNGAQFYNLQSSLLYFRCSSATYHRRGGSNYAKTEIAFFRELKRCGMINNVEFISSVVIRTIVRIAPNRLRTLFYKKILR